VVRGGSLRGSVLCERVCLWGGVICLDVGLEYGSERLQVGSGSLSPASG